MNIKGLFSIWIFYEFHNKFATGENILVVMPICVPSHLRSFIPLVEELIRNGHNVTVISQYPMANLKDMKHNHVEVKTNYGHSENVADAVQSLLRMNRFSGLLTQFKFNIEFAEEVLSLPQLQRIINSQDHYDLIIAELYYMDVFLAFGYKFKAPVVALCPTHLMFFYSWILGNPYPSSYIPNMLLQYTENMSLLSRISNSVFNLFSVFYYEWVVLPKTQKQMEKFFNFDRNDVPDIKNIMRNISVVLVNSHSSFAYVKPELPNVINIGGMHYPSMKPLSEEMKTFLEEASDGVIYVSLGSFLEPSNFMELGNTFIRVLKDFPQRVVMKWDPKLLTEIPENILVEEWISQTQVLNHPNCRLFITHGGLHSAFESLNASVPILGIPIISDQYHNMAIAEYLGIGKMILFDEVSSKLSIEIREVLDNPIYKENAIKRSKLFRERLSNPLDEAMYWVNHVMQHKNTSHLKSAAVKLTWYEFYAVDVYVILLAMILSIFLAIKLFIAWILRRLQAKIKIIYPDKGQRPRRKYYKGN